MARSSLQRAVQWRRGHRPAGALGQLVKAPHRSGLGPAPAAAPVAPTHGPTPLAAARRVDETASCLARALGRVARARVGHAGPRARARRTSRVVRSAARASASDGDGPARASVRLGRPR